MFAGCILCEYGTDVLGTGSMFIMFLSMADNTETLLHTKPTSARNSDSIFIPAVQHIFVHRSANG